MYGRAQKSSTMANDEDDLEEAKKEQLIDEEDSSEFIDNPNSSPLQATRYITTTPLKKNPIRTPTSSAKRKSLFEIKEKRNSRLFSTNIDKSRAFNDTLNFDDNEDILDFNQSMIPRFEQSPNSWAQKLSSNTSTEIEELKKKVTGYQLQIRLIMDFLQRNGTNDLLHKLESEEFNLPTCVKCEEKDRIMVSLQRDVADFKHKYETAEKQLQLFRDQLDTTNNQLQSLLDLIDASDSLVHEILDSLEPELEDNMREELIEARDKEIDVQLEVIAIALKQVIDKTYSQNVDPTPAANEKVRSLSHGLDKLQSNFNGSRKQLQSIENQLSDSITESQKLVASYNSLKDAYQEQQHIIDNLNEANSKQSHKIAQLTSLARDLRHDTGPEESQKIESLSHTLERTKLSSEKNNDEFSQKVLSLEAEKIALSDDLASADAKIEDLSKQISQVTKKYDLHIQSLSGRLQQAEEDVVAKTRELALVKKDLSTQQSNASSKERTYQSKIDELSRELHSAIGRESSANGEKLRFKHELDSAIENIKVLRESLNFTAEKSSIDETSQFDDKDFWNLKYEELLTSDTKIVSKFLILFEEILDSKSIEQARAKVSEFSTRSPSPKDQPRVKELHESIFQYCVSGIQAVIQDYLALIKQSEHLEREKNSKILSLTNELNQARANTRGKPVEGKNDEILMLRIEELTNKWKMERESRKSENDSAKRRFAELERENAELKQRLRNSHIVD